MFTSQHSRTAISAFVTVLTLALSAPGAVTAKELVVADEQVLAAAEQDPALAPAAPSWDETNGSGAVEAIRAAIGHDVVVSVRGTGHEASAAMGSSRDDLSGYGSVQANRAAGYGAVEWTRASASALLAPVVAPSTGADDIPAALATLQRAESAHPATAPLPCEDTADGALAAS